MKPTRPPKLRPRRYAKPLSLYPLKPEEALRAFMQVNPARVEAGMQAMKKRRA